MASRRVLSLTLLLLAACASEGAPARDAYPVSSEGTAPTMTPARARTALADAIVRGSACRRLEGAALAACSTARAPSGWEPIRRDVDAWTAKLSDDAICAVGRRSHEHDVLSAGIDLAGSARREIVFDLRERRAAVFTKAAGDLVVDRLHLFTSDAADAVPVDEEADGTRVAVMNAAAARRLRILVGPEGSPYGEGYAVSDVATRALATATAVARPRVEGGRIVFSNAGDLATAIVASTHPGDRLAVEAALRAIAGEVACGGTAAPTSFHALADELDVGDRLADWFAASPSFDAMPEADPFESASVASCATDPSMACAGNQVCTNAAESFCCADPLPITNACTDASTCADGESCVLAANEPDENGNMLTCADASGGACAAIAGAAKTTRSVSLKYEGTCEFLRTCSSYSRGLAAGTVKWGCEGVAECSDSDRWVAGPNRSYCGKTVQFCKGGTCTTAKVRDVSVSRDWEGSNGVMDALDLPHGLAGRCSGYGGGKVTVRVL